MTRTAMGGIIGIPIRKYNAPLAMTSGLLLPVIKRTAAGARKITKASATSHQQKYMKIPLFAPFAILECFPAP